MRRKCQMNNIWILIAIVSNVCRTRGLLFSYFFSMGIMWSRDFHDCIYQLKSYWMKMRLLNEDKNFEWNYKNYWKTKLLNRYWSHWVKQNKGNMKTATQKIATRMIPTGQFSPGKLSPKKIPTQDNSHPENSHLG